MLDLADLRAGFHGRVTAHQDADYDSARAVWNGEIDWRPAVVARCAGAADVAAAIRFARDADLDLTVRGGGHNFGGAAVADGAVMIHLGDMNTVSVDPAARTARCGGGATWAQLDAATQQHGLATPGGTISHTGVAGLTLGGGFGCLTHEFGLSCDNLLSATVVTADGRTTRAAADEHPDLFWALRGGGGNFGVVTEFEFRPPPVGPIVQVAMFFWELEHRQEALRLGREITGSVPARTGA
jgi:FAD/FMN-containing dehydrogenase